MQPLKGKIAVVAGATRGTGRGVARIAETAQLRNQMRS